jgi:hypothetical protein
MRQNDNIRLGTLLTGDPCLLPKDALMTHAAVLGMTGSGKTGLLLGMTEELIYRRIPVVMVDIKGDMINLALKSKLLDKMAIRCLTPGALHGESVDVFADLSDKDKVTTAATSLLKMVGEDYDPLKSNAHSYLCTILEKRHAKNLPCSIVKLIHAVQDPGFAHLGAMDLDFAFTKRSRTKLARSLNNLLVAPSFRKWREGVALSLRELLTPRPDGKVPVIVYSVAHLVNQDEQSFAIQLLLEEVLPWMRRQGGSTKLRTALVIDECVGLMPPHPRNPPTKTPLLLLLKQGRAFGLGVVLASQNPVDLDYKGMSNCATWMVGRLQMGKDKARIVANVCSSSPVSHADMELKIGRLQPRQFVLAQTSSSRIFDTRDVGCELAGPLTPDEIAAMYTRGELVRAPVADTGMGAVIHRLFKAGS